MAGQNYFRNVNMIHQIDVTNTTQPIDIYTPGFLDPANIVAGAKYSGFITSLRLTVHINSIDETDLGDLENADESEMQALLAQIEAANPKKGLSIYIQNSLSNTIKICDVSLYCRRPYYFLDLMPYLTGVATFDVGSDTHLIFQSTDLGYGLLEFNDRIVVLGAAVEESPVIA